MFSSDDILKQINPEDVDDQIYEIKITCGKVVKPRSGFGRKKTNQMGTKAYKIKRPMLGTMKISMFCMFCERDYKLRVMSDQSMSRKRYWSLLWFSFFVIGLDFIFDFDIIWILSLFLSYFVYQRIKISFAESSKNHETRVIREFEPIGVNFTS
ncbi:MAG: hypothetical protein GPJ54_20205 [Candidatus Heimdallarchaeota archaeon]|nr:hypothetical protein [Candidatus Heimdallarchaeota archaeon]